MSTLYNATWEATSSGTCITAGSTDWRPPQERWRSFVADPVFSALDASDSGNSGEVSAESRRFRSGDRLDKQDKLTDNEVDIWGVFKFNWVYESRYVYIYIYISYIMYDIVQ